jgi:AcrR family transcriptional regulator
MARPRSDIQERILGAAHGRFLAEGVEATSLRNIAKDADTTIGMVYYYYTTKDDLFLAIVEEPYQAFLVDVEAIFASKQNFQERLSGFFGRIGGMSSAEQDILKLIVRESLTSNERRDRLIRRFLRGHLPLVMRAIVEALASKEVDQALHPLVLMVCTFAFASATNVLSRLAQRSTGECQEANLVPEFMRDALRDFPTRVPNSAEIAELLSRILMRAIAPAQG